MKWHHEVNYFRNRDWISRTWAQMRRRSKLGKDRFIRVFLSSTHSDLRLERLYVIGELERHYTQDGERCRPFWVTAMENHQLERERELAEKGYREGSPELYADNMQYAERWSATGIRDADLLVYLMGDRYGSMTIRGPFGLEHSLTSLELSWARQFGTPALAYRLKQPLDDEQELKRQLGYLQPHRIAKAEVNWNEAADFSRKLWLESFFREIEEISTGAELARRVRQGAEAVAKRIDRSILLMQSCLAVIGALALFGLLHLTGTARPAAAIFTYLLSFLGVSFPQRCDNGAVILLLAIGLSGLTLIAFGVLKVIAGQVERSRFWLLTGAPLVVAFGVLWLHVSC
jgi:uncharacterized protein DUF4062